MRSPFLPLLLLSFAAFSQDQKNAALIEKGRYLIEDIGACHTCHTPQLENGEFDRSKWLEGSVLNIAPIKPVQGWHKTAPGLTPDGKLWERWKEEGVRKYLITGLNPKGNKADAPMPLYKYSPADADAIIAYLKSLKK
jgi:mono/diheme cytochrome c family protein